MDLAKTLSDQSNGGTHLSSQSALSSPPSFSSPSTSAFSSHEILSRPEKESSKVKGSQGKTKNSRRKAVDIPSALQVSQVITETVVFVCSFYCTFHMPFIGPNRRLLI